MKSFKVLAVFVLIVVFLLGGLSLAMATVTAPLEFPEARAELRVRTGTVELQKSGTTTWVEVAEPIEVVVGDSVRTAEDSEADINLYDQGILHVAENTTLTIEEALWSSDQPDVLEGEIFLEAGNLWSRLFDFVSPDSDFEVRTSSTVATVRGTTFWVGALPSNTSRVYVDDHAVEVRSLVGGGTLEVTDGEMARLIRTGEGPVLRFDQPPSGADLEIIEKYRKWDAEYEGEVQARQLAFARQARKIDPESSLYNFQRFSERVRLTLATNDDKRQELRERFMAGRVLDAYIEFAERDDLARTRILLQHAQEFGGDNIALSPRVRQALLYFGRSEAESPGDLRQLLQDAQLREIEIPQVEPSREGTTLDTKVQQPVVQGRIIEKLGR